MACQLHPRCIGWVPGAGVRSARAPLACAVPCTAGVADYQLPLEDGGGGSCCWSNRGSAQSTRAGMEVVEGQHGSRVLIWRLGGLKVVGVSAAGGRPCLDVVVGLPIIARPTGGLHHLSRALHP